MAFYPDLRKEVALAVAMEDQFGLSLRSVRLHRMRHYIRGGAAVSALNQQSRRSVCRILDPILACRERHLPRRECEGNIHEQGLLRLHDRTRCQEGQRQNACDSEKRLFHDILLFARFSAVPDRQLEPFSPEAAL